MNKTLLALTIGVLAQAFAGQATATLLSFDTLTSTDGNFAVGSSYVEQGFRLDDLTPGGFGFAAWGTDSPYYSGSTALMNEDDAGITRLTQLGGGLFNLDAIALSVMFPGVTGPGAVSVSFNGTRADLSTVSQTFLVDDGAPQTFSFIGFTGLTEVTWRNDALYHQFDDLQVTAVPEPESLALVLAGLCAIGSLARRRGPA